MTTYRLNEILPDQREDFQTLMRLYGVQGAVKSAGRVGTLERVYSELETNPAFDIPADMEMSYGGSVRVNGDPMKAEAVAKYNKGRPAARHESAKPAYGYEYAALRKAVAHAPGYTRDNGTRRVGEASRKIFSCSHFNLIKVANLTSLSAFKRWMDANCDDGDHRYFNKAVYVHGLLFEGVHFNQETAQPPVGFVPLALVAESPEVSIELPLKPRPYVTKAKVKKDNKPSALTISQHGYVVLGRYIITSFPSHEAWLRSQPKITVTDDALMDKWRGIILGTVETARKEALEQVAKLNAKLLEEERKLGMVTLLVNAAKDNTNKAIRDNLDRLRSIPELESFEVTSFGFSLITNNMMATRQHTGEERYCGKFEIQVSMHGKARVRNIASPSENYRNPHGSCTGSFSTIFGSALRTFDYYTLILAIMEYYRMVDEAYDHKWELIPNSKTPPKKTFVSDWQVVVGNTWDATDANEMERALLGKLLEQYDEDEVEDDEEEDED